MNILLLEKMSGGFVGMVRDIYIYRQLREYVYLICIPKRLKQSRKGRGIQLPIVLIHY